MTIRSTFTLDLPVAMTACWQGVTIPEALLEVVQGRGERVAVVDGDHELTFNDLWNRSQTLAQRLLDLGVGQGDVVSVQLPNWWETFVVYGAVSILGGICNPLVTLLREHELAFIVDQAQPKVIVIPSVYRSVSFPQLYERVLSRTNFVPHVLVVRAENSDYAPFEALALAAEDQPKPLSLEPSSLDVVDGPRSQDITLLMYTSGTTAEPKGVLHHHDALIYEVRSIADLFDLGVDDTIYMVSPLSHISGYLFAFLMSTVTGATTVLQDLWDPAVGADLIERHRCRFTLAAPVFLAGLIAEYMARGTESSLRVFMCGGADVPGELVYTGQEVLGAVVVRTYGLTELPTLTSGRPDGGGANATTDGFLIGPAECRVDGANDEGELLIRGPELFSGYLNPAHNDSIEDDGFFRTGDIARLGSNGTVTILGRVKDIVVRAGEKFSAREIEELILRHPEVADVAVVPAPDLVVGERVCAFIVPRSGAEPGVQQLDEFLTEIGVARQKHPEVVFLLSELPRTASGKVQKHVLCAEVNRTTGGSLESPPGSSRSRNSAIVQ